MRLLIVVPHQDRATGNRVTAERLQEGLIGRGHQVTVAATGEAPDELSGIVATARPELVLLLHAWRSGRPWLLTGSPLPFAVLLTGTDVNAGISDPQQGPVIATVLARAAAILSQNELTVTALHRAHPELSGRLHYLPPGIRLGTASFPLRQALSAAAGDFVLLCPAGIRPVKGVLDLPALVDPLIQAGYPLRLALCGPILDDDYGERLLAAIAGRPWADYLGVIPPDAMPDAMRQADVIVSNSFSEGLPNALVEAVTLGRPVVARDIPGNRAVIAAGRDGLLYSDAAGFEKAIRDLYDDPPLRAALSRPDPQRFSAEHEALILERILEEVAAGRNAILARQQSDLTGSG